MGNDVHLHTLNISHFVKDNAKFEYRLQMRRDLTRCSNRVIERRLLDALRAPSAVPIRVAQAFLIQFGALAGLSLLDLRTLDFRRPDNVTSASPAPISLELGPTVNILGIAISSYTLPYTLP